jgi:hypothetical protein
VTIEERLRAANQAVADGMRPVRPLELPGEQPARVPAGRRSRRWLSWGAPLAAAALVTAVAVVLALVRQAGGPPPVTPTPATGGSAAALASIPRYYVALAGVGPSRPGVLKAVVGDDQTGRTVAVLNPSAGQNFQGVTGAADDRTFVVTSYAGTETTWYLLRLTPGAARPAQLTKLPIKPVAARVAGLALSPDGRELAVIWTATTKTNAVTYLVVYSVTSGAAQRTWTTKVDSTNPSGGWAYGQGLSWVNGDQSIDFRWQVLKYGTGIYTNMIRRVDVTAPGGDLVADSRVAVRLLNNVAVTKTMRSWPCATSLTAGNGTVVCGTLSTGASFQEVCSTVPPSFVTYSGTTGKRLKVLYQYHGQCLYAVSDVVWTDPTASRVIAFLLLSEKGINMAATDQFGVVTDGRFTPLPKLVVGNGNASDAGGLAF